MVEDSQTQINGRGWEIHGRDPIPVRKEHPQKRIPLEAIRAIGKKDWLGPPFRKVRRTPEEWGVTGPCILCEQTAGPELFLVAYSALLLALPRRSSMTAARSRAAMLPRLASGELLGSITMTEPYAGLTLPPLKLPVSGRDHYLVNGISGFKRGRRCRLVHDLC